MSGDRSLRISTLDRLRACGAGAATGAGVVVAEAFAWAALGALTAASAEPSLPWPYALGTALLFVAYAFIGAYFVFFVGMAVVGLPVWFLAERAGRRSPLDAVFAGTVLSGLAGVATVASSGASGGPALAAFVQIGLAGAAAGWTLHRVAYGKAAKA